MAKKSEQKASYDIMIMGGGQVPNLSSKEASKLSEKLSKEVKGILEKQLPNADLDVQTMVEEVYPEPTPEQRARVKAHSAEIRSGWQKELEEENKTLLNKQFDVAEHWANRSDLSTREVAHGVVWGIHKLRDENNAASYQAQEALGKEVSGYDRLMKENVMSTQYAKVYDERLADKIDLGEVLSAKKLFD